MADNFDYRSANKFYLNLEDECKGKQAALGILKAIVDGKRTVEGLERQVVSLKNECSRYADLIGIAKEDAQQAEDVSLLAINKSKARELASDDQVKAKETANADRINELDHEANSKIASIEANVKSKELEAKGREEIADKKAVDAEVKQGKAEAALNKVRDLVGGQV